MHSLPSGVTRETRYNSDQLRRFNWLHDVRLISRQQRWTTILRARERRDRGGRRLPAVGHVQ